MKHLPRRLFPTTSRLALLGLLLFVSTKARAQARELIEPDVMILIDSSGSMDWRDNSNRPVGYGPWDWARVACEADAYNQEDLTSWQKLQEAFLGKIDQSTYHCAVHEPLQRPSLHALRDEDLSDYIPDHISEYKGVSYPHFRAVNCPKEPKDMWQSYGQCIDDSVSGLTVLDGMTRCYNDSDNLYISGTDYYCLDMHPESNPRQTNGILDSFGSTVRFGAMTYDNLPKCWGDQCATDRHSTRWDYGPYRHWDCKGIDSSTSGSIGNICYDWNAGARGGSAEGYAGAIGGLVGIGRNAESTNAKVAKLLDSVEPLYCSPLASLVDDVGHYFAHSDNVLPVTAGGTDEYYRCRPKIAVLITDGQPTSVFEFTAGTCTENSTPADWDPLSTAQNTHEDTGPPFASEDTTIFDCPWRSTPEEAGELFDVGSRLLQQMGVTDVANCKPKSCWPVLLVVVGFNVPEVDCQAEPKRCYNYTPDYTPCWKELPECEPSPDAGVDDETVCQMTPKQFLNEIACQGWPWNPRDAAASINYGSAGSAPHFTPFTPPWLDETKSAQYLCGDENEPGDFICRKYDTDMDRALFVNDSNELAKILDMILVEMTSNVATRTDLVVWNKASVSGFNEMDVAQYEFRSGYVAKSGRPWKGVLTRKDRTCAVDNSDSTTTVKNIAEQILKQGRSRKILSYYNDTPAYSPEEPDFANVTGWLDQNVLGNGLKSLSDAEFGDCAFGVGEYVGDPMLCASQSSVATLIRNETLDRGLADIYNSTPALLGPPYDRLSSASYQTYRMSGNLARAPYLFVGTNDGVLHAVDVDEVSSGDDAEPERWGFIPKSLLKELLAIYPVPRINLIRDTLGTVTGYEMETGGSSGLYRHEFLMDGPPVARDALLIRRADQYDPTVETAAWRAVVFGSSGKNARTHYALDVTDTVVDPDNDLPKLRWEISPDDALYGNNAVGSEGRDALDELGMPVSKPALAYVRQEVGENKEKTVMAAALVPGGWKANPDPNAPDPHKNGNTGLYVLRLADGKVIRHLDPQTDICDGGVGLIYEEDGSEKEYWDGAQFIGEPLIPHGTRSLNVTSHAFIGDDRGRIWLIDLNEADPADWCLDLYFDTLIAWHYPYEDCVDTVTTPCTQSDDCIWTDCCAESEAELPCGYKARNMKAPRVMLIGAPTVASDENNKDILVFGTGQYDELTAWNRNRIFSVTDTTSVVDGRVVHTPEVNWWLGDPVPTGDPFEDIPLPAVKTRLLGFEAQLEDNTYVNPTDFPDESENTGEGSGEAPQAFWNVGEKLIGRPVIFDEVAYFTTFVPVNDKNDTEDACDEGASRVWALDYKRYDPAAESTSQTYIGKFYNGEEYIPYRNYYHEMFSGVQVVKRPMCGPDDTAVFELAVQSANTNADVSGSGAPGIDAVQTTTINIDKRNSTGLTAVRFDSWSIVF